MPLDSQQTAITSSSGADRCQICHRLLNDPADPIRSIDCGGDCLQCMADCGDIDCIVEMAKIDPEHYRLDE